MENLSKQEVIVLVDEEGTLVFDSWYKNMLKYTNKVYTVVIVPDYRDECKREETLNNLLCCEDYRSVTVYLGLEKPFKGEWYKKGDLF